MEIQKPAREEGFYWIRLSDDREWEIGRWSETLGYGSWELCGSEREWLDHQIKDVGTRVFAPEEKA